jgi:hypothetical protein
VKVLRHRIIIRHESVFTRIFTDEFDLINDGPDPVKVVAVRPSGSAGTPDSQFHLPALIVTDAAGARLAAVPNKVLRAASGGGLAPGTVTVTLDKPLESKGTAVLRFEYRDAYGRRTPSLRLFSGAEYILTLNLSHEEDFFTHLVVIAPADAELRPTAGLVSPPFEKLSYESEHYHETLGDQTVDIAIPDQTVDRKFRFAYSLSPEREERRMFQAVVAGSWAFSILFFCLGALSFAPQLTTTPPFETVGGHLVLIGGSIIAVIVGFLGFVTNPLTHRTKLWLLVPLVLAGLMIGLGLGQ